MLLNVHFGSNAIRMYLLQISVWTKENMGFEYWMRYLFKNLPHHEELDQCNSTKIDWPSRSQLQIDLEQYLLNQLPSGKKHVKNGFSYTRAG